MGKVNDAIDLVKTGLEVNVHLATAEQKEKLADAKLALADLKENVASLKEENNQLREMLKKKDEFVLEKGVAWKMSDIEKNQPYCPVCFSKSREIPLQKLWDGRQKDRTLWKCPEKSCNAMYNPWDHQEYTR